MRRLQRIPVDLIHLVVMRGLDPHIHHLRRTYAERMDPRVKPAGDGSRWAIAGSNRPGIAVASAVCMMLLLCGCGLSMTQQRKYRTYSPSTLWADGTSARPLPDSTVAQGDLTLAAIAATPPEASPALLARGRERFDIYCAPCHGLAGDGDGVIVAHGFPKPPSYHIDRLLAAPASHLYDVMSKGYGVMYSYSDRVDPHDRWAIVAYIRALQFSRRAKVAEIPEAQDVLR